MSVRLRVFSDDAGSVTLCEDCWRDQHILDDWGITDKVWDTWTPVTGSMCANCCCTDDAAETFGMGDTR